MKNECKINILQNNPLNIRDNYSSEFSVGLNTSKTPPYKYKQYNSYKVISSMGSSHPFKKFKLFHHENLIRKMR